MRVNNIIFIRGVGVNEQKDKLGEVEEGLKVINTLTKQARIEEVKKAIRELENTTIDELIDDMEDRYSEFLDDCYPEIQIGNLSFNPSRIVKELDPIAFRVGCSDYADSLASDIRELSEWDDIQEKIDALNEELEELESEEE